MSVLRTILEMIFGGVLDEPSIFDGSKTLTDEEKTNIKDRSLESDTTGLPVGFHQRDSSNDEEDFV